MHLHTSVQQCNEVFTFSQELEKYSSSQKWLKIKLWDFVNIILTEHSALSNIVRCLKAIWLAQYYNSVRCVLTKEVDKVFHKFPPWLISDVGSGCTTVGERKEGMPRKGKNWIEFQFEEYEQRVKVKV